MISNSFATRVGLVMSIGAATVPLAAAYETHGAEADATAQAAAQERDPMAPHRNEIRRMTADGGVMTASNAAYADDDGGITDYGQHFEALPGGVTARGCLWGERDGEATAVFWHFFVGWDPIAEQGFFYQSHPAGLVGFGHGAALEDGGHWIEQRFIGQGVPPWGRHESRWFGTDSVASRSLNSDTGSDWRLSRTYTWVRAPDRQPPC